LFNIQAIKFFCKTIAEREEGRQGDPVFVDREFGKVYEGMDLKTQVVIIGGGIRGVGIARDRDVYLE